MASRKRRSKPGAGPTVGLFVFAVLPGSIVAGYLHSTDRTGAACYGIAAIALGTVLPLVAGSILFFVLFEFFVGSPGIVSLLSMGLAVPVLAMVVLCGGGVGGVIGARLRERPA